jgi:hypothetical protein
MRSDRAAILAVLQDPAVLTDWEGPKLDLALRQLRRMKLLAHVGERLERRDLFDRLSQGVIDQFRSAMTMANARARLARWELTQLARILRPGPDNPVVVLKGSAYLLAKLPHAEGRLLADVDLLVPEAALQSTEERLLRAGWEGAPLNEHDDRYYREWTHEIPPLRHVEREMEVDVHFGILQRKARLKPSAALLIAAARRIGKDGYSVLAPEDMTLHAMTHLFGSSEQADALRELVDIDSLLRYFTSADGAFWDRFASRVRQLGLMRPACYALRYAQTWLGTEVPTAINRDLRRDGPSAPVRWVMDCLVPGAMFARHPDRPDHVSDISRFLLLARSHWIRMPPFLLARHLANKTMRRLRSRGGESA